MAEPLRMCAGCREHIAKKELIRVVKTPEGTLLLDAVGKASGRGAYICRKMQCLEKVRKSRALERALGVAIPPEAYDTLAARLNEEI